MIYICSPYSHPNPLIREARFRAVCRFAARMMREGKVVLSPIAHSHNIALAGSLPGDWEFWRPFGVAWLAACSSVIVLRLEGWNESIGVQEEIRLSIEAGKPVTYVDPEPEDLR